jgi:hypothetical protein
VRGAEAARFPLRGFLTSVGWILVAVAAVRVIDLGLNWIGLGNDWLMAGGLAVVAVVAVVAELRRRRA